MTSKSPLIDVINEFSDSDDEYETLSTEILLGVATLPSCYTSSDQIEKPRCRRRFGRLQEPFQQIPPNPSSSSMSHSNKFRNKSQATEPKTEDYSSSRCPPLNKPKERPKPSHSPPKPPNKRCYSYSDRVNSLTEEDKMRIYNRLDADVERLRRAGLYPPPREVRGGIWGAWDELSYEMMMAVLFMIFSLALYMV